MKKLIIALSLPLMFLIAGVATGEGAVSPDASSNQSSGEVKELKTWHKKQNLQCIVCHEEAVPTGPSKQFKCVSCHGSAEDMAKKTEKMGKRNPHFSIHFEAALPCEECHKEHKRPYNYCTEPCHRNWPNSIPGK